MGNEPDGTTRGNPPENPAEAQAKADAEYDKAFEEAEKAESADPEKKATDGQAPPDDGAAKEAPITEKPAGDTTPPGGSEGGERDEHHGDPGSLKKALNDTKTAFTRVSQENAELRRQIDAAKRGEGDPDALEKAKQAATQANDDFDALKAKLVQDYPELEGFMDATAKQIRGLREEVTELKKGKEKDTEAEARKQALDAFNAKVKPVILEEHKDFDAIMADPEYWKWAEDPNRRPSIRFAAMDSSDPEDIKMAIREYKKFKATPEAERLREQEEKTKDERLRNAQSMKPGAAPLLPKGSSKKDPKDYDGGWDEAGAELEREGVRTR